MWCGLKLKDRDVAYVSFGLIPQVTCKPCLEKAFVELTARVMKLHARIVEIS